MGAPRMAQHDMRQVVQKEARRWLVDPSPDTAIRNGKLRRSQGSVEDSAWESGASDGGEGILRNYRNAKPQRAASDQSKTQRNAGNIGATSEAVWSAHWVGCYQTTPKKTGGVAVLGSG